MIDVFFTSPHEDPDSEEEEEDAKFDNDDNTKSEDFDDMPNLGEDDKKDEDDEPEDEDHDQEDDLNVKDLDENNEEIDTSKETKEDTETAKPDEEEAVKEDSDKKVEETEELSFEDKVEEKKVEEEPKTEEKAEEKVESKSDEKASTESEKPVEETEEKVETKTETETKTDETPATPQGDDKEEGESSQDEETKEGSQSTEAFGENSTVATEQTEVTAATEEEIEATRFEMLEKFLEFLKPKEELNNVLSGYFSRLCMIFLQKRRDQFVEYVYTKEGVLDLFINHITNKSITDVVAKLLSQTLVKGLSFEELQGKKEQIIHDIVKKFAAGNDEEDHLNAAHILGDMALNKDLFPLLGNAKVIENLKTYITCDSQTAGRHSTKLLSVIINQLKHSNDKKPEARVHPFGDDDDDVLVGEGQETKDEETETLNTNKVTLAAIEMIPDLLKELDREHTQTTYRNTTNKIFPIFGARRMQVLQVFKSLVHLNDDAQTNDLRTKLLESNVFSKLTDIFYTYPENSFIQISFEEIHRHIMKTADDAYKMAYFAQTGFSTKMQEHALQRVNFEFESGRLFRSSASAFTNKMANLVIETSMKIESFEQTLQASDDFKAYQGGDLKLYNDLNSRSLTGPPGPDTSNDDKDEDDDEYGDIFKNFSSGGLRGTIGKEDENEKDDEDDDPFSIQSDNKSKDDPWYTKDNQEEDDPFSNILGDIKKGQSKSDDSDSDDSDADSDSSEYMSNTFWQVPDMFSIDQLLNSNLN